MNIFSQNTCARLKYIYSCCFFFLNSLWMYTKRLLCIRPATRQYIENSTRSTQTFTLFVYKGSYHTFSIKCICIGFSSFFFCWFSVAHDHRPSEQLESWNEILSQFRSEPNIEVFVSCICHSVLSLDHTRNKIINIKNKKNKNFVENTAVNDKTIFFIQMNKVQQKKEK